MEIIKIITSMEVIEKKSDVVNVEMVGQKTIGLLDVPLCWRLPFFVIHRDVFEVYKCGSVDERKRLLAFVVEKIREITHEWEIVEDKRIIVRSSGSTEGMRERGKYESKTCELEEVYDTIVELYDSLLKYSGEGIAYIVQPYVSRKEYGHLSNERRVSKTARDCKLEFANTDKPVVSIGIRIWRKSYREERIIHETLCCEHDTEIKTTLRKVAYYYYSGNRKDERWHLEFVWDGKQVYIVQNDREELDETSENPTVFPIGINRVRETDNFKVLRLVNEMDGEIYRKVQNALLYQRLGLKTAPLYILDDRNTISLLAQGKIEEELKQDLCGLVGESIVIRTDVDMAESPDAQLLPRSNELRSFKEVMEWFRSKLSKVLRYKRVAIIVHIFIPSLSAAFAYATPKSRVVTIHALWGLPEGLYYNAHDTFLLDTGTKNVQHIDVDKIMISSVKTDYKKVYIAPDLNGRWKEKKVRPPHDWGKSITDQQAKFIAKGSRIIAQETGIPLSIMWFVGIDENYYQVDCLPWYHEQYKDNAFSHEIYKKKYFTEKEVTITNEKDLEKYENDDFLRAITIHPKDDDTLRNAEFIAKVGAFAKRKEIAIFLEGTILAHPVYRLMDQGVRVVLAKRGKELIDRMQFDKLVRDKIPEKIAGNMETIRCYRVYGNVRIRYLKEKLVEETYEFLDASTRKERCEELADMFEVVSSIKKQCNIWKTEKLNVSRNKRLPMVATDTLMAELPELPLLSDEIEWNTTFPLGNVTFNVERMHQNIECEIKITKSLSFFSKCNRDADNQKQEDSKYRKIIEQVYDILDEIEPEKIIQLCNDLERQIQHEICNGKVTAKDFDEICRKKTEKNGGFDEGFVLRDTAIHTRGEEQRRDEKQLCFDVDELENYSELRELLFSPVTYIDYRDKEGAELIIRIKYPLCFEAWDNEFVGAAIENMFGEQKKLIIRAIRKRGHYSFQMYIRENIYEQLTLPDL